MDVLGNQKSKGALMGEAGSMGALGKFSGQVR